MRNVLMFLFGLMPCLCTASADNTFRSNNDVDVIALYEKEIKHKSTGIYSLSGYHFFHQRIPVEKRGDMFSRIRAKRKACFAAQSAVFDWLSVREKKTVVPQVPAFMRMQELSDKVRGVKKVVRRFDLPCHVLGEEEDLKGQCVYAIAISDSTLSNELAQGCFESRPKRVLEVWRHTVKHLVNSENDLDFFVSFGVCDLATLTAADRQGVKCLGIGKIPEEDACDICICDLKKAVNPSTNAAKEYVDLLERIPEMLSEEFQRVSVLTNTERRVRVMLRSYASCPVERMTSMPADLDRCMAFLGGKGDKEKAASAFINALNNVSGEPLMWIGLGETLLRMDAPALAASALRNAVRLDRKNVYATDRLAEAYRQLKCEELSKGLALMTFGLTEEHEFLKYSAAILGVELK